MEFSQPPQGVMTGPARSKAERVVVKERLEERGQQSAEHFLCHAIADGRNAQRALLPPAFVDVPSAGWPGLIRSSGFEVSHQSGQVLFEVGLEHLDALAVDARRSAIAFHAAEGRVHQVEGDPTRQRVVLDRERFGSIHFQLSPRVEIADDAAPDGPWRVFLSDVPEERKRSGPPLRAVTAGDASCSHGPSRGCRLSSVLPFTAGANAVASAPVGYSGRAAVPEAKAPEKGPKKAEQKPARKIEKKAADKPEKDEKTPKKAAKDDKAGKPMEDKPPQAGKAKARDKTVGKVDEKAGEKGDDKAGGKGDGKAGGKDAAKAGEKPGEQSEAKADKKDDGGKKKDS